MATQTTSTIVIGASPPDVMTVIADVEAYPEWMTSIYDVRVLTTAAGGRPEEARFGLEVGPVKDTYTLAYAWIGDQQVQWHLVESQLITQLEGSYTLAALADTSTQVTYQLTVDVALPMLGFIKRKAEKMIIDTALTELKRRVEMLSGDHKDGEHE
jgi:ribosome-associated toxin RatA of RatAB toxin-antitoxin module